VGFDVSRDGRSLAYAVDRSEGDIILVDNVR